MKDGEIKQSGKYNDILISGTDFMELVGAHEEALSALDSLKEDTEINSDQRSPRSAKPVLHREESKKSQDDSWEAKGELVQDEERERGSVGLSVYWKYITTGYGGLLLPFAMLSQILFQVLDVGSTYWMAWATPVSKDEPGPVGRSTLILVYLALAVATGVCIFIRAVLIATIGYTTANILFKKLIMCIFRAPMSFFDSTPSGRILNRVRELLLLFAVKASPDTSFLAGFNRSEYA